MSGTREETIFMAHLAEQAERYEDMVVYMKRVAEMGAELSPDERNLLSAAFKNAVGSARQAWRQVYIHEQRQAPGSQVGELINGYRLKIEDQLTAKCNEVIDIVTNVLVPKASNAEAQVFFLKMKGDYYRYLSEFTSGDTRSNYANNALSSYQSATDAAAGLAATHPSRLGLALNFSVFYFEVLNSPEKACGLAKTAFDEALAVQDQLDEDSYKQCQDIMQLLRDNLTLWTADVQQQTGAEMDGTAVEDM
eukprot:TRINITY_DN63509_c0_g1_i1.p1 TRINITY_DN63509_c0_g1~~TRINITY_DN63509_c0_g1_i1.p1  ORF type:complete len:273 (+),score=59.90 TRINITY_DN63509_c0_g1_i1:71-820(+)